MSVRTQRDPESAVWGGAGSLKNRRQPKGSYIKEACCWLLAMPFVVATHGMPHYALAGVSWPDCAWKDSAFARRKSHSMSGWNRAIWFVRIWQLPQTVSGFAPMDFEAAWDCVTRTSLDL